MSTDPKPDAEPAMSLGLVVLPERTVDRDFAISEGYQSFSGELLRLALLGIAGIGFLLVQLDPGTKETPSVIRANLGTIQVPLYVALLCFALCSATALAHRYCSADGLACHVKYLRLRLTGLRDEDESVMRERLWRKRLWTMGTWLLASAAVTLAVGAGALACAFALAVGLLSS